MTGQLEQDPVLRSALVLKQQIAPELAAAAGDPVHKI
jgi:hypothetical protein